MRILVLDTIHGGTELARSLNQQGHTVEMVDVYRGRDGISSADAAGRDYDLLVAPVHLDPSYHLFREIPAPSCTHHQAARWILGRNTPSPFVEITGARGKTTTAHALAYVMNGPGILHTSRGTVRYPDKMLISRSGITPSALVGPANLAYETNGWCVAEVSLGFCGAGDIGILTSAEDYRFSSGKKSAVLEKLRSGGQMEKILAAPGIPERWNTLPVESIARVEDDTCRYGYGGISGKFSSALLRLTPYRLPLALAAAAACLLGIDPAGLATFPPVEGRLALRWERGIPVVDDSNSGTGAATVREAVNYARGVAGPERPVTLVIGKEDGAICEGFPEKDIRNVISYADPGSIILVGEAYRGMDLPDREVSFCRTLEEGRNLALRNAGNGCVVLAVKTWR
jgi:hypothetical protein